MDGRLLLARTSLGTKGWPPPPFSNGDINLSTRHVWTGEPRAPPSRRLQQRWFNDLAQGDGAGSGELLYLAGSSSKARSDLLVLC